LVFFIAALAAGALPTARIAEKAPAALPPDALAACTALRESSAPRPPKKPVTVLLSSSSLLSDRVTGCCCCGVAVV